MKNLQLSSLRRALVIAAISGVTVSGATAVAAAPASKTSKAKRGTAADLVVRDLEVDVLGETLAISADLKNIGSKKAGRSAVLVAISSDEQLDEDDEVVDELELRRVQPGKSREIDSEIDIPDDESLPDGDVYLLVCADGYDGVREKSEDNNCASELIASEDDAESDDVEVEDDSASDDSGDEVEVSEDA